MNRIRKNWIRGFVVLGLGVSAFAGPVPPALAQGVTSLPAAITANGPSVVHDATFIDVKTEVSSIEIPSTTLSVVILKVKNMPQSARNRSFGAHVHTKPCATDPAASGPHHANPAAAATTALAAKEIWLDVNVDSLGRGTAIALFDWRIRKGDAGSVVIHAEPTNYAAGTAGARILCTTIALGT